MQSGVAFGQFRRNQKNFDRASVKNALRSGERVFRMAAKPDEEVHFSAAYRATNVICEEHSVVNRPIGQNKSLNGGYVKDGPKPDLSPVHGDGSVRNQRSGPARQAVLRTGDPETRFSAMPTGKSNNAAIQQSAASLNAEPAVEPR